MTQSAQKLQEPLTLVSHTLCPYVQRAVIALTEKGVPFERKDVDLSNKPDWFKKISPLGKTPVLVVGEQPIFESAVIAEYLEETAPNPLHPQDALSRADHRAWIEFGSAILNDISGFYNAKDAESFEAKRAQIAERFARLETRVKAAPWFDGESFSLVDAVFGPVFRYFDTFERFGTFGFFDETPKVRRWRETLSARPSVQKAVSPAYPELLTEFLKNRGSYLSGLIEAKAA
ncbi:glutathione S-transferase family protein [Tepidicaulis sp.]|uniref:glutathione S-transferase family protein n=1 Tax=Tepidicaulis sp. TaxID=1920809 RepID=UPI003B5A8A76